MAVNPPKALTFDQLQKYKNANFGELNTAFNANNYGFKSLDDFANAHYTNFGLNEITSGARANPFAEATAAPAPTPTPAPPSPAAAGITQQQLDASIGAALERFQPAAAPPAPALAAAPTVTPVTNTVREEDTSAGRLQKMLAEDGAYIQQARAQARDEMAGRGLLSSTMAANAGQQAAIAGARDFALQDSNLLANQQLANQETLNNVATANANRALDLSKFNAQSANEFTALGYKARLDSSLAALQSSLRGAENASAADLDMMKAKYGADLDLVKLGAAHGLDMQRLAQAQRNDLEKLGVAQGMDLEKMRIGQGLDLEKLSVANNYDLGKLAIANDYETQRLILGNQLDVASKEKLAEVSYKYDQLTKTSQTAASFVAQHITDVNKILQDPNIPKEQKQQLIDQTLNNLGASMKMLDGIYKADFAGLIPVVPPPAAAPAPAPAPAPVAAAG